MKLLDKFFARQAKRPYGFFGKLIGRLMVKGNGAINQFMKEHMVLQPTDHVLEIGFGSGQLIHEMAGRCEFVAGIDISEVMVREARKRNKKFPHVEVKQAGVEAIPYEDNRFDKVGTANTLYFWPDAEQAAGEIFRVLKPGGRLVLGFRNREQLETVSFTKHEFSLYSEEEVTALLQGAGFSDIKIVDREEMKFNSICAIGTKS